MNKDVDVEMSQMPWKTGTAGVEAPSGARGWLKDRGPLTTGYAVE